MKNLTFLFLLLTSTCINAQNFYFPEKNVQWKEVSPELYKIDNLKIRNAIDFATSNEYSGDPDLRIAILKGFSREPFHKILGPTKKRGGPAGVILKNGYIIGKWGDLKRVDMTFSVTKSYLSTVAGIAYDKGLIPNLDEKLSERVWDKTFKGNHNNKITWTHLLNQSSDWSGELWETFDWGDRPISKSIDSMRYRKLHKPGSHYKYNDVRVNVLAYSLLNVFREPLPKILRNNIMDQIGASSSWRWYGYDNSWVNIDGQWLQSVSGGGHSGGGMFINTLDHARFGLLFLSNGNWNGKQLISEEWIKKATSPSEANPSYGYMWWLNNPKGKRFWKKIPSNIYYASGFGGNYIIIIPDEKIVVVARWLEPKKLYEFMEHLFKAL
ncbi:MAG: CubicO group peptidase (beta-lactamase class C family) [Candidatus Marivariicella framensis]|jgi:CubicO group peptidase (beta-lactamase class C family)|tara:strand:+ start:5174 stop:6319 length:1146 start_codon:yes stop_codon:yes gene_type:complete